MKLNMIIAFVVTVVLLAFISGCKKEERNSGSVYFYIFDIPNEAPNASNLPITVTIQAIGSQRITNPEPFSLPAGTKPYGCGSMGGATFSLPAGSWFYSATGAGGYSDTGTIYMTTDTCILHALHE